MSQKQTDVCLTHWYNSLILCFDTFLLSPIRIKAFVIVIVIVIVMSSLMINAVITCMMVSDGITTQYGGILTRMISDRVVLHELFTPASFLEREDEYLIKSQPGCIFLFYLDVPKLVIRICF